MADKKSRIKIAFIKKRRVLGGSSERSSPSCLLAVASECDVKRLALLVCEVNFNRVPYAVGTSGGCREYLYSRSEVGLCLTEK